MQALWRADAASIACDPHDIGPMQVTQEDGGRLNAFAKEPRMVVMEQGEARDPSTRLLLIGGAALVGVLVAVAAGIS
jgi:hypothetical protein